MVCKTEPLLPFFSPHLTVLPCEEWACRGRGWVCPFPACLYTITNILRLMKEIKIVKSTEVTVCLDVPGLACPQCILCLWRDQSLRSTCRTLLQAPAGTGTSSLLWAWAENDGRAHWRTHIYKHRGGGIITSYILCRKMLFVWLHHYLTISWWHSIHHFHLPPAADADNNHQS